MKRLFLVAALAVALASQPVVAQVQCAGGGCAEVTIVCQAAPSQATTGTANQILATCPIPAGTLSSDGDQLVINGTYASAANTNSKVAIIYVGAAGAGLGGLIVQSLSNAQNNPSYWELYVLFTRRTNTTQSAPSYSTRWGYTGVGALTSGANATLNLSVDNEIVFAATTSVQAADLSLVYYSVTLRKNR